MPTILMHNVAVLDLAKKYRETSLEYLYMLKNEFICIHMQKLGQNKET